MDITAIIASNLTAWMEATPELDTLKKVVAKSHVGFGTVRRAKNGDGNITVQNLTAIAATFGRHPADLMADPSEKNYPIAQGAQAPIAAEPAAVIDFPAALPAELPALISRMNETGVQRLIGAAQMLAEQFPKASKGNAQQ